MKRLVISALAVLLVMGLAPVAGAAPITINATDGQWLASSVLPPGYATIDNSTNPRTAFWGGDVITGSGYEWAPATTPFTVDSTSLTPFVLGTFTHVNRPITAGTSITDIQLSFSMGILNDGTMSGVFYFNHEETPNSGSCAYGNPGDTPCPDRVTVSSPLINQLFSVSGHDYYFTLLGFGTSLPVLVPTYFVTQENSSNAHNVYGLITNAPVAVVPEPTTLLLLGTGLAGLARSLRRKR